MAEKEKETKKFDPITRAINDNYTTDFFGFKHWSPEGFVNRCRMQGITGDLWKHETLSPVLKLLVQNTKDYDEPKLDALLHSFAVAICFNEAAAEAALRRHFYAIKFGLEDVFLVHVAEQEKKRRKLEELAETAESEVLEPKEPIETGEEADELESD
ncbi:MAG: hypothetical protein FJ045_05355 [Crenarchaeota archaeon]|nr:hypothetical protein [Thermoproteota archaeon]